MPLAGNTPITKMKGLAEIHSSNDQRGRDLLDRIVTAIGNVAEEQQNAVLTTLINGSTRKRGGGSEDKLRALMAQVGVELPSKPTRIEQPRYQERSRWDW